MIKNYFSKIFLALKMARNTRTFINLLVNSKKYSNKLKKGELDSNNTDFEKYNLKILDHDVDISMRTYRGDISIFYEIFWNKVYSMPDDLSISPKIIVDLGGHVGFTSLYYALNYPDSKIYTIEASRENFKILSSNVKQFESITAINKAIYPSDGEVLFDESGHSYNTKISEEGSPISSVSVNTLMQTYNLEKIDLMKIDIEGAEEQLLKLNNEWLHKVDYIIIELHKPYEIKNLRKDLEPFGFKIITPNKENGLTNIVATKV